jgi:hypothetical protein
VAHDGLILEDVLSRLSEAGAGGRTTEARSPPRRSHLYPSAAQGDHHSAWPFDATALRHQGRIHELTDLHPGQLQLVSIEHPTGGTPAWAEAYLLCRRP